MYQTYNNYYNLGYGYWNLEANSLNHSLNNLQLSQKNLYYQNYDIKYAPQLIQSNYMLSSSYDNANIYNNQDLIAHYQKLGYIIDYGNATDNQVQNNPTPEVPSIKKRNSSTNSVKKSKTNKKKEYRNSSYVESNKLYLSRKNKSDTTMNTRYVANGSSAMATSELNNDDLNSDYSCFDVFDKYKKLIGTELNDKEINRLKRNQECLTILIEGDLIEYVEKETDMDERDKLQKWAVYMGNSMIMRFDNIKKLIIYESYWKIANENYVYINRDLDKRLLTLPIYETLDRARDAHANNLTMSKNFFSDKYFAMWCRFDINKSDIEVATDNGNYSSTAAKEFLFEKFFQSIIDFEEYFERKFLKLTLTDSEFKQSST